MKKHIIPFMLAAILLTACGSGLSPEDQVKTAEVLAQTMIAETQAARPTDTFTLQPTTTSLPSSTPEPTFTATVTLIATITPTATTAFITFTPTAFQAGWKVSSIRFINETGQPVNVVFPAPVYREFNISNQPVIIEIDFGTYNFLTTIGDGQTIHKSIFINNIDRYTIFFRDGRVIINTP